MFTLSEILQIAACLVIWTALRHWNAEPTTKEDEYDVVADINTYIPNCFNN